MKRGHYECGDSAFAYCDAGKAILGVFDGVSGEPGAAIASSDAATAVLNSLKNAERPGAKELKQALIDGHLAIRLGATTATVLIILKDRSFIAASVGDSPLYGINAKGKLALELPLARSVGDGDSILKFFHFRAIVTEVLGGAGEPRARIREGKLKRGEGFILASDGLSDNLFVKSSGGYVSDTSGEADLKALIADEKSPKTLVSSLMGRVSKRIAGERAEEPGRVLVPKQDDVAIAAVELL